MRAKLVGNRLRIGPVQRKQWGTAITQSLMDGFPILQWMIVSFYWPHKGAFNPKRVMRMLRERGSTVAFPMATGERDPLQFRQWQPGTRAIKHSSALPSEHAPAIVRPQALIIPMIGFDEQGHRLGDGTGFFDRTLVLMSPQPLKIGVAYEVSRIWTIHPQPHDIVMDFVATESAIYHVADNRLTAVPDIDMAMELTGDLILRRDKEHAQDKANDRDYVPQEYASPVCYLNDPESRYADL